MAHAPLVHAFDEASAIHDSSRCKHFLRPVALEMTGLVSDPPDPFPTTDACMQPRCAASSSMVYTAAYRAWWTRPLSSTWEENLFTAVAWTLTPCSSRR